MEGRGDHRSRIGIALLLIASAFTGGRAVADEHPEEPIIGKANRTSIVYNTPDSTVVDIEVKATAPPSQSTHAPTRKRSCRLEHIETEPGPGADNPNNIALPRPPDQEPYWLVCDGEVVGIVWRKVDSGQARAPVPQPRDIALRARDEIPIPTAEVKVNPEGSGMVGTESWFWIQGYDGSPISHVTNAFGLVVEVEARVTRYRWSFGDGMTLDSQTLGRAYPDRSEIRHTYQRSSAGRPSGYKIDVEFNFSVRYRIDGGPWIDLPPITRTARVDYPVRESQAVITR